MPDRMLIKPDPPRQRWILLLIIAACVAVLVIFRLQGLLLILPILAVAMLVMSRRPDTTEPLALRTSNTLSAEDNEDVTARRFLSRLDARLAAENLEGSQLETILTVTDMRALEIKETWLAARQAAQRLGHDY